jgi:hypothetical protein
VSAEHKRTGKRVTIGYASSRSHARMIGDKLSSDPFWSGLEVEDRFSNP